MTRLTRTALAARTAVLRAAVELLDSQARYDQHGEFDSTQVLRQELCRHELRLASFDRLQIDVGQSA